MKMGSRGTQRKNANFNRNTLPSITDKFHEKDSFCEELKTSEQEEPYRVMSSNKKTSSDSEFSGDSGSGSSGTISIISRLSEIGKRRDGSRSTFTVNLPPPDINTKIDLTAQLMGDLSPLSFTSSTNSGTRHLRKISKVTGGKTRTTQEDLAQAVLEGNLRKIEEIIDVFIAMNGPSGLDIVLGYRYDYDTTKQIIQSVHTFSHFNQESCEKYTMNLSVLGLCCIFDAEHVISLLSLYGIFRIKELFHAPQFPLHTAAMYGSIGCIKILEKLGVDLDMVGYRGETALHTAARDLNEDAIFTLLKLKADPNIQDDTQRTPLFYCINNYGCLKTLVQFGADLNHADRERKTPIHLVRDKVCLVYLLESGADPKLKDSQGGDAIHRFLEVNVDLLTALLDFYITSSTTGTSKGLEVSLQFGEFVSPDSNLEKGLELAITAVSEEKIELLKHPIIETLIHFHDTFAGRTFRIFLIIVYIFYLASITSLVTLNHHKYFRMMDDEWIRLVRIILGVGTTVMLILITILLWKRNFSRRGSNYRFIWLLNFLLVLAYITFVSIQHLIQPIEASVIPQLGTMCLFLSWIYITDILGQFPNVGIYILMVQEVAGDLLKFLLMYTTVLLAFTLSFQIVFEHDSRFSDPFLSLLSTITMMMGEMETASLFSEELHYPGVSHLLFFLFLLFVSVVIMNLLIGLAISNLTEIFQRAGVERLKVTVLNLTSIYKVYTIIRRKKGLFRYLKKLQGSKDPESEPTELILYTGTQAEQFFVRDQASGTVRTGFRVQPWIRENAKKALERKNEIKKQRDMLEVKKDGTALKLEENVKSLKKELKDLHSDVKFIKEVLMAKRLL
ncbi:transient receptor potential channel pyrexia [Eurytemora carolleeae]|uniref:transient receptor potential channel pyrexia n=1 Tax=Eurytemora carolleeae TaxID=1294199 RepID=UPI000C76F84B|nr:transient receptor potential channel pyrexia [Eurytemora carolleeae]|eukprot:XP_023328277.1 transient receptor potential channel pyrexia-like [Eurytemora affinis]